MTNQKRIRYIVAWLPRADTCVIVGLSGSKVGLDEGWYRLKYDDDGREAYDSGPHESAEVALGAHEPKAPLVEGYCCCPKSGTPHERTPQCDI